MTTLTLGASTVTKSPNQLAVWLWRVGGAVLYAVLMFTALQARVAIAESKEETHYAQIQQQLQDLKDGVRDLRQDVREALRR